MEENVNKAASWEDVLNDNFNAETQEEVLAVQEEEVGQVDQVIDQANDQANDQVIEQSTEQIGGEVSVEDNVQVTNEVIEAVNQLSDLDPNKQALIDAILNGNDDLVYNYYVQKNTDYSQINDFDIISKKIASENPTWDKDDIQLEIETKYGSGILSEKINLDEIDKDIYPEEYKDAIKFNKEVDRAEKLLKRDAKETRASLEKAKENISLPVSEKKVTEQVKDNNESVDDSALSEAEIQRLQQEWISAVEKEVPGVNEFKFKLGDEDVSYKITDDEQRQLVDKMKTFNAESYLVDRGWVNKDGTPNVKKITEDVYILENNEKIFRSGWTQSKEKAKMDLISKDIKNISLDVSTNTVDAKSGNPYAYGEFVLGL